MKIVAQIEKHLDQAIIIDNCFIIFSAINTFVLDHSKLKHVHDHMSKLEELTQKSALTSTCRTLKFDITGMVKAAKELGHWCMLDIMGLSSSNKIPPFSISLIEWIIESYEQRKVDINLNVKIKNFYKKLEEKKKKGGNAITKSKTNQSGKNPKKKNKQNESGSESQSKDLFKNS